MPRKKGYNKKNNYPKVVIKKTKYKPEILDLKDLFLSDTNKNTFKILKNNIEEINVENIKKRQCKSIDKLEKKLSVLTLTDRIIASYNIKPINEKNVDSIEIKNTDLKEEENNKTKDIIKNEKNMEITNEVTFIEDSFKNNTPYKIVYNNYIYNYEGNNPKKKIQITWHCQNYRKIKNLPTNYTKFCNSIIQGNRDKIDTNKFKFYLKKNHSDICIKLCNKKLDDNGTVEDKIINSEEIKMPIISNKKDFNSHLETYIKNNKELKIDCQSFIKYGLKFYNNNNLKEIFKIDKIYLKNIYYRIIKKYYQLNLENIYEYAEKLPNEENFCRSVTIKQLIGKDKKIINQKAIIFFSDFDIKKLSFSKHLLLDGTFIFPSGFSQTIIIMYYDEILDKMLPGIYIAINNKTEEGYKDVFRYIKYYIDNILKDREKNYHFETFTTDFEIALYNAFNKIFNKEKNIRQIGCYFHYLQNIRKYFQKKGLTKNIYKNIYNNLMSSAKQLPFKELKENKLIDFIKNNYKSILNNNKEENIEDSKIILDEFIDYFKFQWLDYFNKDILNLNGIYIKFRSNNCLENFNRQLKRYSLRKRQLNLVNYVDILINESIEHEEYIITEMKKPLQKVTNKKLNPKTIKLEENNFYMEIAEDILNYSIENDSEEIENINLNLEQKYQNENNKKKENELLDLDSIFKNYTLTSDILFHSLIGIDNLSVNCFFNTGLQIILHSHKFILEIIYDITNNIEKKNYNQNSLSTAFIELMKNIIKTFIEKNEIRTIDNIYDSIIRNEINIKTNNISISPKNILDLFTSKHPMYKNSQEDCVEFIRVFLNDLSIENNINSSNKSYKELSYEGKNKYEASKEFHNNYIRRENSAVIKNFYFQMMNIYVCSCGYETFSFDKYLDLPLLIPDQQKNYKLIDLIKYRLNSKLNEWSQKCENCKLAGLNHNRFEKFDMISNYIIIYIQRINKFEKTKNNSIIEFEENLNLGEFFVEKNISKNGLFKLLCIIYHEGSLDCGHYYVIIKIRDKWFKFSDDKVKLLNTIQFKSKDVCAFVYEK